MCVPHCEKMKSCIPVFKCLLCCISFLIVADWPLHYIIQNFKRFPLKFKNFIDATFLIPPGWTPMNTSDAFYKFDIYACETPIRDHSVTTC